MRRYKVEYEHNGEDGFAIVFADDYEDAKENFLCLFREDETDTDPEINDISLYLIYDEIHDERIRQITEEGYSLKHDDELKHGELAAAAAVYAFPGMLERTLLWPFRNPPKVKDLRRNLVRAAALLVAEIERLDRLSERGEIMPEKTPWREGLQTDSFIFRLSKDFNEFDLKVIIEHKVLESGETVASVMTGKENYIPKKFRDFHCCDLKWNRGVEVDVNKLAEGFIADYFRDYYVLSENEWIPTIFWKQDIHWSYSF